MYKCVTYNTQQKLLHHSEMNGMDLTDVDFVFLQRCKFKFASQLHSKFGFKLNWQNSTDADNNVGLCVLSKKDIEVSIVKVNVNIDHEDPNQSDKYQVANIDGYRIINFLPPFLPTDELGSYVQQLTNADFDFAIGDIHVDPKDPIRYEKLSKFLNNKYHVNKKVNFVNMNATPLMLSWLIDGSNRLYVTDEQVEIDTNKTMCHFPLTFTLNKKESV
jgi:hypothetical protein